MWQTASHGRIPVQVALTSDGFLKSSDHAGPRGQCNPAIDNEVSMAFEVRSCGTMHRLRDKASEWPIRVRVTTANAGCASTRILNVDRRRPKVKAVSARAPTGSS